MINFVKLIYKMVFQLNLQYQFEFIVSPGNVKTFYLAPVSPGPHFHEFDGRNEYLKIKAVLSQFRWSDSS